MGSKASVAALYPVHAIANDFAVFLLKRSQAVEGLQLIQRASRQEGVQPSPPPPTDPDTLHHPQLPQQQPQQPPQQQPQQRTRTLLLGWREPGPFTTEVSKGLKGGRGEGRVEGRSYA